MAVLYLVSTPIGNLEDITLRAIRILKEVDGIVCEDTRETRKLLEHYEVRKPLYSLHERSPEKEYRFIVSLLEAGKNLAYVTDAGTPGIADPGNKLVHEITESQKHKIIINFSVISSGAEGEVERSRDRRGTKFDEVSPLPRTGGVGRNDIKIIPIPGSSALTAALSICGFNMQEFQFYGFLPHKKGRQTKVKEIVDSEVPVVLFESKYRITKLLYELLKFGIQKDRDVMVANDLTKKFERVYRGTIDEILQEIKKEEPKGEFVVVISANSQQKAVNSKD